MPRNIALSVFNSCENVPGLHERTLEAAFGLNPRLDQRDRAFSMHLVQGVLRWQIKIDWMIKQSVRFPFTNIELPVLNILRLAVYQIFFMDRVPESAAVNEAVKQAGKLRKKNLRGVVNGILRNICRKKNDMVFPDAGRDYSLHMAIIYSYPLWLVKKWKREYGAREAEKILRAGNDIPGLFIRTNTLRTDRQKLEEILQEEGMVCSSDPSSPESIEITRLKGQIHKLKSFKQGLFQVQSRPAQICSHLLSPEPGESVLDVCAGFGGKSTHMAALMEDRGFVLGMDTNRERIQGMVDSAGRLGIGSISPIVADANQNILRLLKKPFDKILVDAPCSGLGVISRHPDIKLVKTGKDIGRLADLQQAMLNRAVALLKSEGRLLYVTCTISKEENEGNVERFLKKNPSIALVDFRKCAPEWVLNMVDTNGFFRTLPHVHGMEGFFGALFMKK
jgi:16S rRNA (cytosine967-C5)-methyltransferase